MSNISANEAKPAVSAKRVYRYPSPLTIEHLPNPERTKCLDAITWISIVSLDSPIDVIRVPVSTIYVPSTNWARSEKT